MMRDIKDTTFLQNDNAKSQATFHILYIGNSVTFSFIGNLNFYLV